MKDIVDVAIGEKTSCPVEESSLVALPPFAAPIQRSEIVIAQKPVLVALERFGRDGGPPKRWLIILERNGWENG